MCTSPFHLLTKPKCQLCFKWATPRTGWKDLAFSPSGGHVPRRASIGPPRERGGKDTIWEMTRDQLLSLQLGHPANGVERIASSTTILPGSRCFNWATPRTGWKEESLRAAALEREASIGPPRERGGKQAVRRDDPNEHYGFNWATPRTGWKGSGWSPRASATSPPASIGPPRERGGKRASNQRQRLRASASIGPPRERGGKKPKQ